MKYLYKSPLFILQKIIDFNLESISYFEIDKIIYLKLPKKYYVHQLKNSHLLYMYFSKTND